MGNLPQSQKIAFYPIIAYFTNILPIYCMYKIYIAGINHSDFPHMLL